MKSFRTIMSTPDFSRFLARTAAVLLIAGTPLFGDSADATQAPADQGQKTDSVAKAAPKKIYEGMPATELQSLIGKPVKVVPVAAAKGQAEVWIYKRLKKSTTDMVTVGNKPITMRQKQGDNYVDVVVSNEPIQKTRTTEIFEVASFLIVNGQYITRTTTEETNQSFL